MDTHKNARLAEAAAVESRLRRSSRGSGADRMSSIAARGGAGLHVVPECGHYVPIEKPDILNAILRDVIAEQERR
jgi:pimeloyl-ACP methyl ester carboxylesterase